MNDKGQIISCGYGLGLGIPNPNEMVPQNDPLFFQLSPSKLPFHQEVSQIHSGLNYSLALTSFFSFFFLFFFPLIINSFKKKKKKKEKGELFSWGWGKFGQLALGTTDNSYSPSQVHFCSQTFFFSFFSSLKTIRHSNCNNIRSL